MVAVRVDPRRERAEPVAGLALLSKVPKRKMVGAITFLTTRSKSTSRMSPSMTPMNRDYTPRLPCRGGHSKLKRHRYQCRGRRHCVVPTPKALHFVFAHISFVLVRSPLYVAHSTARSSVGAARHVAHHRCQLPRRLRISLMILPCTVTHADRLAGHRVDEFVCN